MNNIRLKILFFASWYPNKYDNTLGIFVKNKARAVASLCDVAVIYVAKDLSVKKNFNVESAYEENIFTVRVYFRTSAISLIDALLYNFRYLQAYYLAWKVVKHHWGTPDLIHVNVVDRAGLPALFFKWLKRIPFVITEHSTPDVAYTKGEKTKPLFRRKLLKRIIWWQSAGGSVDSIISQKFLKKMGITSNICIIPNVVYIDKTLSKKAANPSAHNKKIGLHISILIERKNVHDIIEAAARLSKSRQDFEIHIVGTGEQKDQLVEYARERNVLDRVIIFHGYVTDEKKSELIAQSDFHILNSDEEGFSVATAESLCYGVPVITTDCGGPEDFVSENNGIIIKRRDLDGLTRAIAQMLDTAHVYNRAQISTNACSRFTPDIVAQQTYNMYWTAKTVWAVGNTAKMIFISPDARVLDVGSGHQPHRRANVLLEKYPEETIHRTTQQIVIPQGKEFIVGDALAMPFSDKSFDFIIASHIAEHIDDPAQFCREVSRVGKEGYIETPGPMTEYLMPTRSHTWIVTKEKNALHFQENSIKRSPFPFFHRFFYLNRDGYVERTWKTSNKLLIFLNLILVKMWVHIPYAYTRIVWKDEITCTVTSN